MKMRLGGLLLLLLLWALTASAADEPAMVAARKAVYGGASWKAPGSAVPQEVNEVFRARYREQGQEKLILIYQLTPGPREQFRCQACQPGLGGAVLVQGEKGDWTVQARGELLLTGAPASGPEDLQLIQLGQERWALRSRFRDVAQGLETLRERLLLQEQGQLVLALDEGFVDKPGPGACGAAAAAQSTALLALSGSHAAPRLELVLRYNEGACPAPKPKVERRRFELRDGRFQPE